jgi:hypothetical protein
MARPATTTDAILHHMRKTPRFIQKFSNQKLLNFLCAIYSLIFNGKQFVERGKIRRKEKQNNEIISKLFSHKKISLLFFFSILPSAFLPVQQEPKTVFH